MRKRALIVASVASHIKQFCMDDIQILMDLGYQIDVAANFDTGNAIDDEAVATYKVQLDNFGIGYYQVDFVRHFSNISGHIDAMRRMSEILKNGRYELIHCHTPIAGALCRLIAKKYRKNGTKVLYTAHGFHFYQGAPLKNWLLFYPVERLCAKWTDILITINREDLVLAKSKMSARKIEYIPGIGINLEHFYPSKFSTEEIRKTRETLGLGEEEKMLLSVGELTKRKNHELVIRALAEIKDPHLYYYICGCGELEEYLRTLIKQQGLNKWVFLLGYRRDVDLLHACTDLFVFPSLQEGLPVALMEAIASGIPAIASNIRGNNELLEPQALFRTKPNQLAEKIRKYVYDPDPIETVRNLDHIQSFSRDQVVSRMWEIYSDCLGGMNGRTKETDN